MSNGYLMKTPSTRIKCHSVRLESLTAISPKAYLACCFDGSEALLPASQIFGEDGGEAWWVSAWILEKKTIQFSRKRTAMFCTRTRKLLPVYEVVKHVPTPRSPVERNPISELRKP